MDVVTLTYAEAAERLNIKVASVRQRVIRKKWHTIKGNDGTVRIQIPAEELEKAEAKNAVEPPSVPTMTDREQIASLTAKVDGLEKLVEAERKAHTAQADRADTEKRRADSAEADRDEWRRRAEKRWWKPWN